MPRIALQDLTNLQSEGTAVGQINSNSEIIEDFSETVLTKGGPNVLQSDIDLNNNDIINLPIPVHDTSPVRKKEFDEAIGNFPVLLALAEEVEAAKDAAEDAADAAAATAAGISAAVSADLAAAEAAAELAEAWANNDVGVEVPGSGGGLSAKHWASVAQEAAQGEFSALASAVTVTPAGNIASTNVQAALEELDTELTASLAAKANTSSLTDQSVDANLQSLRWEYNFVHTTGSNLNDLKTPGFYALDGTQTNRPAFQTNPSFLVVQSNGDDSVIRQTLFDGNTQNIWDRIFWSGTWSSWSKIIRDIDMATVTQVRQKAGSPALVSNIWGAVAQGTPIDVSGALNIDFNQGVNFSYRLTGNATVNTPTNIYPGQSGVIVFQQDTTGGRSVSWSSAWRFPASLSNAVSATSSAFSIVSYHCINATTILCTVIRY